MEISWKLHGNLMKISWKSLIGFLTLAQIFIFTLKTYRNFLDTFNRYHLTVMLFNACHVTKHKLKMEFLGTLTKCTV